MSDQTPQEQIARLCSTCGLQKPESEFYGPYKGRTMSDCKVCARARIKASRARNKEHYIAFDRARAMRPDRVAARKAYQHTEAGKAAFYRTTLNMIKKFPEKVRARDLLRKALKSGKLTKQPCEVCGDLKVDGHHDDYGKPLEVRWLCLLHHKQHHGYMKGAPACLTTTL